MALIIRVIWFYSMNWFGVESGVENVDADREIDVLAFKMDGKPVVSVDNINWVEAGKKLKCAVLLKLASGKVIQKESIHDLLSKV